MSPAGDTATRLRRLLAILTWLAQEGEAPVDEVAARFDLTPAALVAELEMAACCGVPPYTPDQLLEIVVTEDTVSTRVGTDLARPRRLSPSEGLALAASARALLAVPGSDEDGALSRALSKLDRALGQTGIEVELDTPDLLDVVRDAVAAGERLRITYYSASSDQTSERTVTPRRLFASEGHWYVDARCEVADGVRRFRVDRIATAVPAGPAAPDVLAEELPPLSGRDEAAPAGGIGAFVPGPDSRKVRIVADPSRGWLFDTIQAAGCGELDGRPVWEVYVGGDAWLERLLLRLGPEAEVVEPAEDRDLAPEAARRILGRYRTTAAGS